ncbi:MAG: type IV secretion system protein [Rhodobacteraceae bacterium]|nr:type IV secretion system protein [Paracoccaceae bacterium]
MFFGVKKRERIAYAVAGGGLAIGLMGMIAVTIMLPLKETEAFLAVVDKDTGVAERVVQVEKAGIGEAEAIRQSLLFAYVTDRETYDQHDNEKRILRAYTWSEANARASLVGLWTEGHPNYPPKLYGESSKVVIDILSITPVTDTTAQVRFTKTWVSDGEGVPDRIGKFTATVTYRFAPSRQTALDLVWQNPTGFLVTDYRMTAETLPQEEG